MLTYAFAQRPAVLLAFLLGFSLPGLYSMNMRLEHNNRTPIFSVRVDTTGPEQPFIIQDEFPHLILPGARRTLIVQGKSPHLILAKALYAAAELGSIAMLRYTMQAINELGYEVGEDLLAMCYALARESHGLNEKAVEKILWKHKRTSGREKANTQPPLTLAAVRRRTLATLAAQCRFTSLKRRKALRRTLATLAVLRTLGSTQ